MRLDSIHLFAVKGQGLFIQVHGGPSELGDFPAAQTVIEEQAQQKGIAPALWGIRLPVLELTGFSFGDYHGLGFLVTNAGHGSCLVNVTALFMTEAFDLM